MKDLLVDGCTEVLEFRIFSNLMGKLSAWTSIQIFDLLIRDMLATILHSILTETLSVEKVK